MSLLANNPMLDSKVTRLIQALLSKELSTVERYLCAPYVSSNDECARLFVQICKFLPDMDSPKLTKERLFSKIFGKRPYNDGKMRKLMTQLTQLIEQYLMERELKNSEELQTKLLARALSERSYKLFSEAVESRMKTLDNGEDRGRNYFRESYELSDMLYYHPGSLKLVKKGEYRQRMVDDFERYFSLVMLQNEANNVVVNRVINAAGSKSLFMNAVIQMAETQSFTDNNAIQLFRRLIVLLQSNAEEDLNELRNNAFSTFPHLSQMEQDLAINLLRNYAIPFTNKGSMEHARFAFDLYKMELERGLYANSMSAAAFMNIVSVGLLVDEFDWVQYFIENFDKYLSGEDRINTINYCKGFWHYRKGVKMNDIEEFYNAIQGFNLIPTKSGVNYELRIRTTLLRVHFELFEREKETLDELLNQVRNFERHLRGSAQYAEPIRIGYLNFLRFYKLLARVSSAPQIKQTSVNAYLKKLEKYENSIFLKNWLQEKAKGLATDG